MKYRKHPAPLDTRVVFDYEAGSGSAKTRLGRKQNGF